MRFQILRALKSLVLALCLATGLGSAALAQETKFGCDFNIFGAKDSRRFAQFDRELRSALSTRNIGLLALLTEFPLRINDARGSWYIHDTTSFERRFDELFPVTVRSAVLNSRPEQILCTWSGIMYGPGTGPATVYISVTSREETPAIEEYHIASIGMPLRPLDSVPPVNSQFACETSKYRVLVDLLNGASRFRAWEKPRSLVEQPDLTLPDGVKAFEGTGLCAHRSWTFKGKPADVVVNELGCYPDSNQPPKNATGQFAITPSGKEHQWEWCR